MCLRIAQKRFECAGAQPRPAGSKLMKIKEDGDGLPSRFRESRELHESWEVGFLEGVASQT